MKVNVSIASIFVTMSLSVCASTATYRVRVVDSEDGSPVKDAEVYGGFVMASRGWDNTPPANVDRKRTDISGLCRLSGNTDEGESYFGIRKASYYNSERGEVVFNGGHSLLKLGRWLPDDVVVTARLDRIIKPIPMFVKYVGGLVIVRKRDNSDYVSDDDYAEIISTNKIEFSYDLVKGDWLPPYGNGSHADISVVSWKEFTGRKTFQVPGGFETIEYYRNHANITFNGDGNGVCLVKRHALAGIKIRTAPENGYETNLYRWYNSEGERNTDTSRNYAFHIRTQKDKNGNITSAYYGKVYGDFRVNYLRGIAFRYYLNPTPNDRNLEFDRKTNLNTADKCWPNTIEP